MAELHSEHVSAALHLEHEVGQPGVVKKVFIKNHIFPARTITFAESRHFVSVFPLFYS